jgi:hypothetical protein
MSNFQTEYLLSDEGTSRVMVFPIGKFKTGKYPKLDLSRAKAESVVDNFRNKVLGATEPFIDSSGRHDESSPAAAWVKNVEIAPYKNGEAVFADVEWTSKGRELVRDKQYRYLSPVLAPHVIPETGEKVGPVLRSMSLTNTPVLRMMPEVMAAEGNELAEIELSELTDASDDSASADVVDEGENAPVNQEGEQPVEETEEEIISQVVSVLGRLNDKVRYKRGAPALRALMKEVISKSRIAASDGDDEVFDPIIAALSETGEELNNMLKLVEYLKLADDASEDEILSAFETRLTDAEQAKADVEVKLTETETKLAETEEELATTKTELTEVKKAAHDEAIEHRLAEAISAGTIMPADVGDAEHPGWLRDLAFTDETLLDKYLESRKAPAVDLSEHGSGENEETMDDGLRPDQRLAVVAAKLREEEGLGLSESYTEALKRDEKLAGDYVAYKNEISGR